MQRAALIGIFIIAENFSLGIITRNLQPCKTLQLLGVIFFLSCPTLEFASTC